jgi:hypothetical protein
LSPSFWFLVTAEPVETREQLELIVDAYRARWIIEEFFMALKTGCQIERRQLESYRSLSNALAIFLPIAVRLQALRGRRGRPRLTLHHAHEAADRCFAYPHHEIHGRRVHQ